MKKLLMATVLMPLLVLADTWRDPVSGITWTYTISNGEAQVGSGEFGVSAIPATTMGAISIPSTLGGRSVTSIGFDAFFCCERLTSVSIPSGVTSIGEAAFNSCRAMTAIEIPSSMTTICDYAFQGCSALKSVTIPMSVVNIGEAMFKDCAKLTEVVLPSSVTSIATLMFSGCSGLKSVTIPSSVTSIGDSAFYGCNELSTIIVDHGDTDRIKGLLSGSGKNVSALTFVEKGLPDGGPYRETVSGLKWTFIVNNGEAQVRSGFDASPAISTTTKSAITVPSTLGGCPVTSIGDYAFWGCMELTSVTIPEGVSCIGRSAFQSCVGLTSMTLPSSVTNIEENAFTYCNGISSLSISSNVVCIGGYVFSGCSRLSSVDLPPNIANVANGTFRDCYGLKSVKFPSCVTNIGEYAFEGCVSIASLEIPLGVTSIGRSAFNRCSGLTEMVIPEGVTSIGSYAFGRCDGLSWVALPSSVTNIGDLSFIGCSGVQSFAVAQDNPYYSSVEGFLCSKYGETLIAGINGNVTIPSSVTRVARTSFQNYKGLKSVVIPSNVMSIGDSAFSGCSEMTKAVISAGVTNIEMWAFSYCAGLTSVVLPPSVTILGSSAFSDCEELRSVTIPSSVTSIGSHAFSQCSELKTVYVDKGDTERVSQMLVDSGLDVTTLTFVEPLDDGGPYVETTSDGIAWTFYVRDGESIIGVGLPGDSAISKDTTGVIKIPSTLGGHPVTSIGDSAFSGCNELTSVTIPEGVAGIGDYAFSRCVQLRSVTIPSSVAYVGFGAFATESTLDKVVVSDLEAYASICFADTMANPRNNATALYVGDELRNEMCTVSYTLASDDMNDYMWYAEFNYYGDDWAISDYGRTASCEVPIGSTICFDDLSGGAVTISEWGDHAFDGWDGDGICVISDAKVVAKWRVKTLEEVFSVYGGVYAWGERQYFFLDTNTGCFRSQGALHICADPSSDEYLSGTSYVSEMLKDAGQMQVVMIGYDENYQEVAHTRSPVVRLAGQDIWSCELTETNRVRHISLHLAHSRYEGTYALTSPVDYSSIWEDVSDVEVRSPNVHYIELENQPYYCYDQRYQSGYYGSYESYYYRASMDAVKSGDILCISCFSWSWSWSWGSLWHDNQYMYVYVSEHGMAEEVYGEYDEMVHGASSFEWIIPPSTSEEAREHRIVTIETFIRSSQNANHYFNYEVDIDPDIITHRVDLNYGLQCDWGQMDGSLTELIVDDGFLPELPNVYPLPGWRFVGWSPNPLLPVTNDVEYVAQYEPISYGIAFEDVKGCENANTNAYTVEDEVVFLPLSDLPDYHFDGWSPTSIPVGSTGDVTVVAQWRPIENAEIIGSWSEPRMFEYDGQVHGVDYSAHLDVMDWPLNVVTQGTIRAVGVGEYAATATAETVGVPETESVYYRCVAVTNECNWSITPKPVTKLQIAYVSTAMIANGQQQKPQIVVRDVERGVVLTSVDYSLTYENNVEPGSGVARITGKGNYGGETTIEFPIVAGVSPSEGLNMDGSTFEIVGGTDWIADNVVTHDGYASMRSGAIGDNEESALTAVVHGAGTVSFWWKVSSQHFDSVLELDRLEFYIDGVRQKWVNGDVDWTKLSFKVNGAGPHELKWVYAKDGSVSECRDCGWVDEVTWEKEWLIGDWLNDVDREFATSNVKWTPDTSVSSDGVGSMRSGVCQQGQRSVLSTIVENVGTLTFKWKCSCVAYGEYVTDKLSLLVDGTPVKDAGGKDTFINGETGWCDVSYRITGAGRHEVQWVFEKISDRSMGQDCGWVDVVRWDNEPGTLTDDDLVVDAFDGVYDGRGHGAAVSVKGVQDASVKYGTSRETIGDAASPTFVGCGEHEVWFAVNVPDFTEYVGKAVVRIRPRSIESGVATLGEPLVYTGMVLTQTVASVVVDGLAATFEVSYNEARAAGAYQLTVGGTGNFCGELSVPFAVGKAQASSGDVMVEDYSSEAGAVEFAYDGKTHQPTVVAGYDGAAVVRFALTEEGPYVDELNISNVVERMDVWYEIVSANYERLVGQTQMTIRPQSIAGAEVVLGEQVSDVDGHVVQLVDSVIVNGLSATFVVSNNVAEAEGDFELSVYGVGNFTGEAKCRYSVGGIVLPPILTPGDGTIFAVSQIVKFSAQTPDSKWYYTLDGSMPTTNSQKAVRVNLHGKTTIRAIAVLDGKLRSAVVEAHYALGACKNPKVSLDGQVGSVFHFPEQLVVIDRNGEEGVVRYTLDGSEPTADSPAYEGPFAISASTTVKAKTFSDSWFDSETVTADLRLEVLSVPSPVIQAASEYKGTRTTVSMLCALEGAVIRYTLDGSEPTATSALYEKPFEIGGEVGLEIQVKAMAFREHYADSSVAEAVVTRVWGIGDTLGVPDMMFETDGWVVDAEVAFAGRESMRSGPTDDGETNTIETVVHSGGVIAFAWQTSCEDSSGDFIWDRAEFWVDEECVAKVEGESEWTYVSYAIQHGDADHRLRWHYVKDPDPGTAEGEDCAWLAALTWKPEAAMIPLPSLADDPEATVTGDAETGFVVKPSAGRTSVEVSIPQGVDAAKVTVEVSAKVASVKPNGATVKVVSGGADITEYLNVPAADGNGIVDLTKATVKEEIVKEAMDIEKGAEIKLNAANPTLTTPNTRIGLFYTFSEGRTLGGMERSASKTGDGKPWSPEIKVKGGNSAFYSIGVGKGE